MAGIARSSRVAFHVSMFIPVVLTPTSAIRDIAFSKLVYNDAVVAGLEFPTFLLGILKQNQRN